MRQYHNSPQKTTPIQAAAHRAFRKKKPMHQWLDETLFDAYMRGQPRGRLEIRLMRFSPPPRMIEVRLQRFDRLCADRGGK